MKLLLTVVATVVLLKDTQTIGAMAEFAASGADPHAVPGPLLHSVGGLVVLLMITALSVVKPQRQIIMTYVDTHPDAGGRWPTFSSRHIFWA